MLGLIACGGDSTSPKGPRIYDLLMWNGHATGVWAQVPGGATYMVIDSASVTLRADATVGESIWYKFGSPGSPTDGVEHFSGHYTIVGGNYDVTLPGGGNPEYLVGGGSVTDTRLDLFRSWTRNGFALGGNFVYIEPHYGGP
jgi:hypothetical protein